MVKLICITPEGDFHQECNRNNNRCCMCTSPRVPVELDTLLGWIKKLHTSGDNTKLQVSREIMMLIQSIGNDSNE